MKIVHLCIACFFPDGYSYQENLLPKFHKRMGYEVEVIASLLTFGPHGEAAYLPGPSTYQNEYDIKVTRLPYKRLGRLARKLALVNGLYEALCRSKPDILFIHGCQFGSIVDVTRYLRDNPSVQVYVDNHADYSNSARNPVSKFLLHRILWRYCAHLIEPYVKTFWGVLPSRVDFLTENYGLPREKCKLLVMGGDDDEVLRVKNEMAGEKVRQRIGLDQEACLIVTGGKIDKAKTEVLELMRAVSNMHARSCPNIHLLIFGPVSKDVEEEFSCLLDRECMEYIPWADRHDSYDYFNAADLVVFPGRHSVYWEQAASLGKPLLVKKWRGTDHIDLGGNVCFIDRPNSQSLESALLEIISYKLTDMTASAQSAGPREFLYSNIARKSIK